MATQPQDINPSSMYPLDSTHPDMKASNYPSSPYDKVQQENFQQWQLGYLDTLERIEHGLRSEVWTPLSNEGLGSWENRNKSPVLMNEEGISSILSFLTVHLDRKNQLSNLNEDEIFRLAKPLFKSLAFLLAKNYKRWGLEIDNIELVYRMIEFPIYVGVLKRALDGNTQNAVTPTVHSHETIIRRDENKSPRMFK